MAANYVLLERIELNASAASVTFASIPQSGYTDLKVVVSARGANAGSSTFPMWITFNGSTANQTNKALVGNGTTAYADQDTKIYANITGASATSNTFGSVEFYIPNYTSSNYKSVSVDAVMENNTTTAYSEIEAGLWSSTSAITSITFQDYYQTALFAQYSTFSLYGLAAVGTTPAIAPKASGGNITTDGTYWYHTFLSSGTFTPATALTCDALVVAGGGAGGSQIGGGGGAGGFLGFTNQSLTAADYTVTIGAGGVGTTGAAARGASGSNSQFATLTASVGGGGGGTRDSAQTIGGTGGSGGGGTASAAGGSATSGQGYAGGTPTSNAPGYPGAGGGGAGAVGTNGNASTGGNGGAGLNTYSSWATATSTGVSGYYGGGGGGGTDNPTGGGGTPGTGGSGGGGNAATSRSVGGSNGTANTGGGGGGLSNGAGLNAGSGGSGIIIIRYAMA